MGFNQSLVDFTNFTILWEKKLKNLFKHFQEQVEFLFGYDEIMMNIQYPPKNKHVEFLKLDLIHVLYEFYCI